MRRGEFCRAFCRVSRRAQHPTSFIFSMVIMVVVLLVGIMMFMVLRDTTGKVEEDAICATQIMAHSVALRASGGGAELPITCPTARVTIKNSEEKVKQTLAKEMKRCWAMWGKGQMPLFGDKETVYCHICTMVSVEGVPLVRGLPRYLNETKATGNETYLEYLTGAKTGEGFEGDAFKDGASSDIKTDAPIAVIFYYAKGYTVIQSLLNKVAQEPANGAKVGFMTGLILTSSFHNPFIIPTTAVGGAILSAITPKSKGSTMSFVVVRPLTASDISTLGCEYAPVNSG